MYQEPEMIYRTTQHQTMTSYAPPLSSRVDSDVGKSLGLWGAVGEFVGIALVEWLASPVMGIAVLLVSFCLVAFEVLSDLCRSGVNTLDRRKGKAQK